jgi:phage shock protein PspC (stress-responsive transcriptional regulator)
MIAGVAAGIAQRLEVGVGLVRIAFVVATLFGGVGFVLYGAAWLLLPSDTSDESIAESWLSGNSERNSWGGAVLIGLAVLIVVSSINAIDDSFAVAAALGVIGVLMYRGTFDRDAHTDDTPDSDAPGSALPGSSASSSPDRADDSVDLAAPSAHDAPAAQSRIDAVAPSPGAPEGVEPVAATTAPTSGPARRPGRRETPSPPLSPSRSPKIASEASAMSRRGRERQRSRLGAITFACMLVVFGAMGLAQTTFGASLTAAEYLAAGLFVVGVGLLVGAFWGRSRVLIVLGLILVMLLQLTSWFDVPITGGFGDPRFRPTSVAELEPAYRLAAGDMVVDLSAVADLAELPQPFAVDISLAAGSLRVILPDDVAVNLDVSVVAGDVTTPNGTETGPDIRIVSNEITAEDSAGLDVDVELGFGELVVVER